MCVAVVINIDSSLFRCSSQEICTLYILFFLLLLIRFLLTTFPYKYAVQTASSTRNIPYTFDNKSVSPQALDTISIKIQELGRSHRPCDIILCANLDLHITVVVMFYAIVDNL